MNIIVTVPKKETQQFLGMLESSVDYGHMFNWKLSKYPTKLQPKDDIYFVVDGVLAVKASVMYWARKEIVCKATNKVWKGHVLTCARPIPIDAQQKVKGFRGFRYLKDELSAIEPKEEWDFDLPF